MSPRVIIIGAGIAGLSAAEHLVSHGIQDITILEANDRTGGRMHTVSLGKSGKEIVELGANWIHGAALNNSVFRVASEYKLLEPFVLLKRIQGYVYQPNGSAIEPRITEKVFNLFMEWEEESWKLGKVGDSEGLNYLAYYKQRLQSAMVQFDEADHEAVRCVYNVMLNYAQFHNGDSLAVTPAGGTTYEDIPGGNVKVPHGMTSILQALHNRLPKGCVKLNTIVNKVKWGAEVKVTCEGGASYLVDHVIVTCSLGYLKKHKARLFSPALPPNKADAIDRIEFGRVNKIFLQYDQPFWAKGSGGIYLGWTDDDLELEKADLWYKHIFGFDEVLNNPNVLVAWISGSGAAYMEGLTDDEISQTCTSLIRQFIGDPSVPYPQRIIKSQWVSNPYSLGSYSYSGFSTLKDSYSTLAAPLVVASNPQVCFAGEATHAKWYSTIHGARSSGLREAQRIIDHHCATYSRL